MLAKIKAFDKKDAEAAFSSVLIEEPQTGTWFAIYNPENPDSLAGKAKITVGIASDQRTAYHGMIPFKKLQVIACVTLSELEISLKNKGYSASTQITDFGVIGHVFWSDDESTKIAVSQSNNPYGCIRSLSIRQK